ncbi:DUF4064 domain-containing protein [Salinicoccus sp. ID82-1]|uniref:DUF4064 domain-containing protein n=1 Tax=Salinicoccus sp. ID82-1 TaxID=2820269 RepID=UPI001F40DA5B|nr:DUF4064 domain-containing protein [Salinicoccus sp. ID82-1]MCG1008592.1 DUF4064 domain-containing protein [Salinicoccus sp. ID82-1]
MARKNYTQTVEPVSRIAEKIFGWLAWIVLLAITALLLFFSLVTMNDAAFVENFRQDMMAQFQQMAQQGQDLGAAPEEITDLVVSWMNNVWLIALYLMIPLILGLFGLLTMRRRILAGFLLLLAAIFTAPLVLGVIAGLIPLFFVIAAILLFVRKDRVVKNDDMEPLDNRRNDYDRNRSNAYDDRRGVATDDAAYNRRRDMENDLEDNQMNRHGDDPVGRYEQDRENQRRADEIDERRRGERSNDLEETRTFRSLDDHDANSRSSSVTYDDQTGRNRGSDDNDRFIDRNIDSSEATGPVTEQEYTRRGGTAGGNEKDNDTTLNDTADKRRGADYDYDATKERRDNVNRRNNDDL